MGEVSIALADSLQLLDFTGLAIVPVTHAMEALVKGWMDCFDFAITDVESVSVRVA
jgi:hypothetical protein